VFADNDGVNVTENEAVLNYCKEVTTPFKGPAVVPTV